MNPGDTQKPAPTVRELLQSIRMRELTQSIRERVRHKMRVDAKRGRRKERPPSRATLLREMSGAFSIVGKTIKGRRYYYLREQCRQGQLLQKDFYLGRMGFDALPVWIQNIYKGDPSAFEFRAADPGGNIAAALEWWKTIIILADNVRALEKGAPKTKPARRDFRFLKSAKRNVAALESAQLCNARRYKARKS